MPELVNLPEGIGAATAWFVVAATGVTSLIGAAFGLGGGTILLALLAVVLPPGALVPVHGVVQLGATGGRALLMRRHVHWSILPPFVAGTAAGSALSGALFVQLPPWLIQYAIAAFVVWSVFGVAPVFGRRHIVLAGAFSGFLTMLFGATGTFVSAFLKGMRLPSLDHVGTHAALMTLQHALKIAVFGVLGFAFAPYAHLLALMLASGLVGTLLGRHLLVRMGERWFRPLLNALLLLLAARLCWEATLALLAV